MKERLGLLTVILLVVANALLIPLAFKNGQGSTEAASPDTNRNDGLQTEESGEGKRKRPTNPKSVLMSSRGRVIVSASRTYCDGTADPNVRFSADRGATFRPVELDPEVSAVLSLEVSRKERVLVMAADESCRSVGYVSSDRGRTWDRVNPRRGGQWHLDGLAGSKRVRSPNGPVPTPCAPKALSTVNNEVVRLLCPDGRILRSLDGRAWQESGRLKGAVAFRFPIPEIGFALVRRPNCKAAVMRSTDSGANWERLSCLGGQRPRGISGQDGKYAAVVGDSVRISDDGAETWRNP